ncbi:SEC-C motif-containing protein [Kribbella amoyensis]|uniref:SEC-C motif-containing protein n=1 Tax=Kribbella amoyensis TaxID=996641 RepID=A0A561C0G7_9ACTN|nr:YchJ family metal-binding protein [Kribbella amoyensis]TWD84689.1 SEC-C motif-containing protein [Kribbella amoyensis]
MAKRSARRVPPLSATSACPCGLGAAYGDCCGGLHQGRKEAATAEQLMRSRYSAFVVRDEAYLLRSWSTPNRPPSLRFDDRIEWTGLEILGSTDGGPFHTAGTVEFRAHFTENGQAGDQYENSHFVREDGRWVYDAALSEAS